MLLSVNNYIILRSLIRLLSLMAVLPYDRSLFCFGDVIGCLEELLSVQRDVLLKVSDGRVKYVLFSHLVAGNPNWCQNSNHP